MDQITRARPEPLPATIQDLLTRRQRVAPPNLNDKVERIYLELYPDPKFQRYLDAVYASDAQEGSLYADDLLAAQMIRAWATEGDKDLYVAGKNLATIARALNVVQARYGISRKARAGKVGDTSVETETNEAA